MSEKHVWDSITGAFISLNLNDADPELSPAEAEFHATGQLNALGSFIGCSGEVCKALIQRISKENLGHKIQGA